MKTRHVVRVLVLAIIALLVLVNDYASIKGQYGGQDIIESSWLYSRWDRMLGSSPHLESYNSGVRGNLWSFSIAGFRISDPLAVLNAPGDLWISALLPVALTVLLGRVFCGWVCPMGLFSELIVKLRRLLSRFGIRFFNWPVTSRLKYVVLIVGIVFTAVFSVSFFFHIYPPRIVSDLIRDSLVGTSALIGVVFIGVILLAELLFVERLWCRCLCPGGAIYSLLGRWRLLRIRRDTQTCTDCKECDRACPHDLEPSHQELAGECDNCGLCRGACQPAALSYSLTPPLEKGGDK